MRTLLIDFDGTLVDSVPALYAVYLDFLSHHGIQGTPAEFETLNGVALPQFVTRLVHCYDLPGSLESHITHYYVSVARVYTEALALFPGAEKTIRSALAQGIRCAIVTASRQDMVADCLRHCGLLDAFVHIVTPAGLRASKPDPAIYQRALALMENSPDECVAIEDSPHGIAAALGAGIPTLAFGPQWQSETPPENAQPMRDWDAVATHLHLH